MHFILNAFELLKDAVFNGNYGLACFVDLKQSLMLSHTTYCRKDIYLQELNDVFEINH